MGWLLINQKARHEILTIHPAGRCFALRLVDGGWFRIRPSLDANQCPHQLLVVDRFLCRRNETGGISGRSALCESDIYFGGFGRDVDLKRCSVGRMVVGGFLR